MMLYYYVKSDGIWGVPRGSVERFQPMAALQLASEGKIEAFDPKKKDHAKAPGSACAVEALKAQEEEDLARLMLEEAK